MIKNYLKESSWKVAAERANGKDMSSWKLGDENQALWDLNCVEIQSAGKKMRGKGLQL